MGESSAVPQRRGRPRAEGDMVKLTVRLPHDLCYAVRRRALDESTTAGRIVAAALEAYLGRERERPAD